MVEERITFPAADIQLEGILHLPEQGENFPAVVVCHPHPLYGGDMSNNVVVAVCHALAKQSTASLRFNFRGVGRSEGQYSDGVGEREDLGAALDFLSSREMVDSGRIGLVGYSFGAAVALPVALQDKRIRALALISPPLPITELEELKDYPQPKLVLCGETDIFASEQALQFQQVITQTEVQGMVQCELIQGADHFWWGCEGKVGDMVSDFLSVALGTSA